MVPDTDQTHFLAEGGALCGARMAHRLSADESKTTCASCRALLELREQYEAEARAANATAGRKLPER